MSILEISYGRVFEWLIIFGVKKGKEEVIERREIYRDLLRMGKIERNKFNSL